MDSNETLREEAIWELHKNTTSCFENILKAALYKTVTVRPLTHLTNHQDMLSTAREVRKNSLMTFSYEIRHSDTQLLTDQ